MFNLDYSQVEATPPHPNIKVEVVAYEAAVYYCETRHNEADAVRSACP